MRMLVMVFLVLSVSAGANAASRTTQEINDLAFMVEEEKLARDAYLALGKIFSSPLFTNIPQSEQRHMDLVGQLLKDAGAPNPTDGKQPGVFVDQNLQRLYDALMAKGSATLADAMSVGAIIEETDIQDLDKVSSHTTNAGTLRVYQLLTCGSRNHLRAFAQSLSAQNGKPYSAQVLSQKSVDAILNSPHERCGQY